MRTILIGLLVTFICSCSQPMRNMPNDDCDEECQRAVEEEVVELTNRHRTPTPPPTEKPHDEKQVAQKPEHHTVQNEQPEKAERKHQELPQPQRNRPRTHTVHKRQPVRVVKQTRWLPCFMNKPHNIPDGDMLILNNRMHYPIGIKVNGKRLRIIEVGFHGQQQTNWETTHNGLLPINHKCWLIMENPRQTQRVNAVLFRYDHYRRTLHFAGKSVKQLDIRWPRKRSFRLTYDRHTWRY